MNFDEIMPGGGAWFVMIGVTSTGHCLFFDLLDFT